MMKGKRETGKSKTEKIKSEKPKAERRKKGIGIGAKIMALLLLLAITAMSCVGVLVWTLQGVIDTGNSIVSSQVAEQEKISELSRQTVFLY